MRQDLAVPEELFEEYVGCISTYKINTEIVPKFQLEKYIKNKRGLMAKREARGAMKQLSEDVREMFDEAVAALKTLKIKYSIDDATCLPTFTHGKTKKSVSITMEQIETFDVSEEIVGFVKGNVLVEEKNEDV